MWGSCLLFCSRGSERTGCISFPHLWKSLMCVRLSLSLSFLEGQFFLKKDPLACVTTDASEPERLTWETLNCSTMTLSPRWVTPWTWNKFDFVRKKKITAVSQDSRFIGCIYPFQHNKSSWLLWFKRESEPWHLTVIESSMSCMINSLIHPLHWQTGSDDSWQAGEGGRPDREGTNGRRHFLIWRRRWTMQSPGYNEN